VVLGYELLRVLERDRLLALLRRRARVNPKIGPVSSDSSPL